MTPQAKARASEMLAALRHDRFKLYREAELVALGIPYEWRRSTQDDVLREKAAKPIKMRESPPMSEEAFHYWGERHSWARDSLSMARRIRKWRAERGPDQQSQNLIEIMQAQAARVERLWATVPDLDKLRFWDPQPNPRFAWHWPTLAVVGMDHTFAWWPEGTPEYRRQLVLLERASKGQ